MCWLAERDKNRVEGESLSPQRSRQSNNWCYKSVYGCSYVTTLGRGEYRINVVKVFDSSYNEPSRVHFSQSAVLCCRNQHKLLRNYQQVRVWWWSITDISVIYFLCQCFSAFTLTVRIMANEPLLYVNIFQNNTFLLSLLYWKHTKPWPQNWGTYRTVDFVFCYTPTVLRCNGCGSDDVAGVTTDLRRLTDCNQFSSRALTLM